MLQERRSQIIEKIQQDRTVKVADLIQEFGVSIETIRRDLEYLENKGFLKRVYGGAVLHGFYTQEPAYEKREVTHYQEKRAIARAAAELIADGDTLFMDVGTTTLEVISCLAGKKNITVITNATLIAQEAIKNENCRSILLGGELRRGELSVSGYLCDNNLDNFYANKMFLGVGGITADGGITDYHMAEANTRRLMISRSNQVIAVADFSKFGVIAMNRICPIDRINVLVTDWSAPQRTVAEITSRGVNVISAPRVE